MPIVNVQMLAGRPPNKINEVMKNITTIVATTLEVPEERVRVLITEVPETHWGVAGVSMAEMKK